MTIIMILFYPKIPRTRMLLTFIYVCRYLIIMETTLKMKPQYWLHFTLERFVNTCSALTPMIKLPGHGMSLVHTAATSYLVSLQTDVVICGRSYHGILAIADLHVHFWLSHKLKQHL